MKPPFTITSEILTLVANISELVGRLTEQLASQHDVRLRRVNRVRTIQGSLAIEGNTLSEEQITAILAGKRVIAPPREVQEAQNAIKVYDQFSFLQFGSEQDLLKAHKTLMLGLIDTAGAYRSGGVGVMKGDQVIHMAPPANRVPVLMGDLMRWLKQSQDHPLIKSCVFHYEFEFIHPFADGNGRMGRLWQSLILAEWQPLFANLPVESLIHQYQDEYYAAINRSTQITDSAPFIEFMLKMILDVLEEGAESAGEQQTRQVSPQETHQVSPQVIRADIGLKYADISPQVQLLLQSVKGEMLRGELQQKLGLKDRASFRTRYLKPAIEGGWLEMTQPDKPTSRTQRYRLTAKAKSYLQP